MNKSLIERVAEIFNAEEEAADKKLENKTAENEAVAAAPQSVCDKTGEDAASMDNDPFRNGKRNKKTNSIEVKKKLVEAIVNTVTSIKYLDKNYQALQLYIVEPANMLAFSAMLEDPDFEEELRLQLTNAGVNLGRNWQWQYFLKMEPPAAATRIGEGLLLALTGGAKAKNILNGLKARITAETGKLAHAEFVIEDTGKIYNIGRGANPKLDNGAVHQNHIIIAGEDMDGITEGELTANRYVSRAHASIVCEPGKGFALKPLMGGTPFKDNRTRILRAGVEAVDANNTTITYPLQHGDKIELGKNVLLDFEIIA